jgi:hypothetical protein
MAINAAASAAMNTMTALVIEVRKLSIPLRPSALLSTHWEVSPFANRVFSRSMLSPPISRAGRAAPACEHDDLGLVQFVGYRLHAGETVAP